MSDNAIVYVDCDMLVYISRLGICLTYSVSPDQTSDIIVLLPISRASTSLYRFCGTAVHGFSGTLLAISATRLSDVEISTVMFESRCPIEVRKAGSARLRELEPYLHAVVRSFTLSFAFVHFLGLILFK